MDQTGGKLLQQGTYGCIYIPQLKCKGDVQTLPKNDSVSHDIKIDKIMQTKHANIEFAVARRIQALPDWKRYYIVPDVLCEPEPREQQVNANIDNCAVVDKADWKDLRILRMNYGGKTLEEYRINIQQFDFMRIVKNLLEAVALLTLNGICHMDLHDGNILVQDTGDSLVHLIDFNLAIDTKNEADYEKRLFHSYQPRLSQQPPDYTLVNAKARVMDGDTEVPSSNKLIEELIERKTAFRKERSVLGLDKRTQERGLSEFLQKSRVLKAGDLSGWFKMYWRTIDSWAVGVLITDLITRLSLWPEYKLPAPFASPRGIGMRMLRKLCEPNPLNRYDAVQALAMLDPNNPIIERYGKAWLQALS